jgi:hypothetical protein
MHPPHGAAIIRQVLHIGVQAQLERHGFKRRNFIFTRSTPSLRETVTLSVRTDRGAKGSRRSPETARRPGRLFWLIAEVRVLGFEYPPRLDVHAQKWRYDEDLAGAPSTFLDLDDFAVGVGETIERKVVPGFKALRDLRAVARRLEHRGYRTHAAALWHSVGQHGRAAWLEAEEEAELRRTAG